MMLAKAKLLLPLLGPRCGGLAVGNGNGVGMSATSRRSKHNLPDLPYDFDALEPTISAEIMSLHYLKHHSAYVNNYNLAEERMMEAKEKNDITAMIGLERLLRFNGGGHINHSIFWKNLCPESETGEPEGELKAAIYRDFGSFEIMKERLSAAAVGVQGSGWAWLAMKPNSGHLVIETCANQDPLQATTGLVPLFGIDVWEHAYYLQYKNVRPDYVKAIFKVANWKDVAERFPKLTANSLDVKE